MAWTCLWAGCPDQGFRFVYAVPIRRTFPDGSWRIETPHEADLRDGARHHEHAHGIAPDRRNTDNPRLSPTGTLD